LRAQGFLDVRECRTEGAFQVRLPGSSCLLDAAMPRVAFQPGNTHAC